jgi:hypothetical protein
LRLDYIASKGLGWAGGSHFEFGMSSSLQLEPELVPCGWRFPHQRLILMRPSGNGKLVGCIQPEGYGLPRPLTWHQAVQYFVTTWAQDMHPADLCME